MIPFVKPEASELPHSISVCEWGQHTGACSVETKSRGRRGILPPLRFLYTTGMRPLSRSSGQGFCPSSQTIWLVDRHILQELKMPFPPGSSF